MRIPLFFVGLLALCGCSSSQRSNAANDGGPLNNSGSSGGGSSSSGGSSSGDSGFPGYTVQFGPIDVPAYTEKTQCIVARLGNAAAIHVGQIHNRLGNSSHHMIVYRVNDTTEQLTPFACRPFAETLSPGTGNPLIISQKKDDLLALPTGVAFALDANQMIRLEMHYINPTGQTVSLTSTSTMITLPDSEFQNEASFLFIGDTNFMIPAGVSYTLGPKYFQVPSTYANAKFFAMTGHEHQFGTNVQVWTASSATDTGTARYQVPGWTWSEPKTVAFDPPFQLPANGGFTFQCDWFNTSTSPVSFGESATAEMCFFWAYYYPSQGAAVCFHDESTGTPLDLCCPGSPILCATLANREGADGG